MRVLTVFIQMIVLFTLSMQLSFAANDSLVGLWKSFDDKTNKPRSLIRINVNNGEYTAVIEKGLLPTDTGEAICDKCTDERKDQPIIGMTIVKGLKENGNKYDGGYILDPENGKVYKCKMTLNEAGDEIEVRGFIGISLLGRSQMWTRVE
jgi:uncharacterized protein (DUF2147 family)